MKRKGPEELVDDGGPLFSAHNRTTREYVHVPGDMLPIRGTRPPEKARGEKLDQAEAKAKAGRNRAAARASRLDGTWKAQALERIHAFALTHEVFLLEDVAIEIPEGADPRATGAIVRAAVSHGWIRREGFAAAVTSNGSPKALWSSRVWKG